MAYVQKSFIFLAFLAVALSNTLEKELPENRVKRSPKWEISPNVQRDDDGTKGAVEVHKKGENHDVSGSWSSDNNWKVGGTIKIDKRSIQPGTPKFPKWPTKQTRRFRRSPDWTVNPNVEHQNGKTRGTIGIQNTGRDHEFGAKVGTDKSLQVGGTIRSPNWAVSPNVEHLNGRTRGSVGIQNSGRNHEFGATIGTDKSVHVGGSYRFKRSPDWEISPNVQSDNGDTKGTVEVHNNEEKHDFEGSWSTDKDWKVGGTIRIDKRSIQPGTPNFPVPNQNNNGGWQVNPSVNRDDGGNTHTAIGVKHTGPNHNVDAGWSKIVRGHKTKPTWHIGGTYRFKRSPDWTVNPNVEHQNGKTRGTVGIRNSGRNHEFGAKVGTDKSVQVGGTIRFKRSPDWELSPNVDVQTHGDNHDFGGSWSGDKDWKVGGTIRIDKRSIQPGAPNFPVPNQNNNGGWQVNPSVNRDDGGNTHTAIGVKHTGPNHNVDAGWSKIVRGHKAKPTWHIRGTYRFRRSPDWEISPNVQRENGDTKGTVEVHNKGEKHDVHGSWSTDNNWKVGGSFKID